MSKYFLMKSGLYYRPNCCGYTENISRAGIYSKEFALKYERDSKNNGSDRVFAQDISESEWPIKELQEQIKTLETIIAAKNKRLGRE